MTDVSVYIKIFDIEPVYVNLFSLHNFCDSAKESMNVKLTKNLY